MLFTRRKLSQKLITTYNLMSKKIIFCKFVSVNLVINFHL